jgi:2-amino-4-hydroxy-6-hydroxymethyldihydropteridine diphosphokinase
MKLSARSNVIVGLGSNMGDRIVFLAQALVLIEKEAGHIVASSSVWETEPWGFDADELFLNMVIVLETSMEPLKLIQLFRSVEGRMGRPPAAGGQPGRRGMGKYESRIIDIDILFWEDRVISLPGLEVPHPKIADRRFVLAPLCEVAPGAVHPVTGLTAAEMLDMCEDSSDVRLATEQL